MKEEIIERIKAIERELWSHRNEKGSISLLGGTSSFSLFYQMFYALDPKAEYEDKFHEMINGLFDRLNDEAYINTYCSGLAGVAYLLNFYKVNDVLEADDVEDSLLYFDQAILIWVNSLFKNRDFEKDKSATILDFLHGAFGGLFYLNERAKNNLPLQADVQKAFNTAAKYVIEDIERFEKTDGFIFNTGLAHGASSYIVVFAKFLNWNGDNDLVKKALQKCMDTILSLKSTNEKTLSLFPGKIEKKSELTYTVPLGWCYGDQTVLLSLYFGAKAVGNKELEELTKEWALTTLDERVIETSKFMRNNDPALCHGFSSMGYLYKRWYEITKNERFFKAYNHFTKELLKLATYPDCESGFKKSLGEKGKYESSYALLDGSAGIGVYLLDYLLDDPLPWDELFLLR